LTDITIFYSFYFSNGHLIYKLTGEFKNKLIKPTHLTIKYTNNKSGGQYEMIHAG